MGTQQLFLWRNDLNIYPSATLCSSVRTLETCLSVSSTDVSNWYRTNACSEKQKMRPIMVKNKIKNRIRMSAYEPLREKTGFLHMRKQRRRTASR